jgi:hypothetical protein
MLVYQRVLAAWNEVKLVERPRFQRILLQMYRMYRSSIEYSEKPSLATLAGVAGIYERYPAEEPTRLVVWIVNDSIFIYTIYSYI